MITSTLIIAASLLLMSLSVILNWQIHIKNHSIKLYWVFILLCSGLCIYLKYVSWADLQNMIIGTESINPLKILVIFISLTSLSVLLDQVGFFEFLAKKVALKFNSSQTKLFFALNILLAILTVFTSNDILILTFTPFICFFAKHAKIDATPYIVSEFVTANTWSMFFLIGNPTNIYICTIFNIGFIEYARTMFLPTMVAGVVSIMITYFLFRRELQKPIGRASERINKINKPVAAIGVTGLLTTITLMVCSSWAGWNLWIIPFVANVVTLITISCYLLCKKQGLALIRDAFKSIPYELIPFLLGMSVIIEALNNIGIINIFASLLENADIFMIGTIAFLCGNIVNNIPMTMLFAKIFSSIPSIPIKATYSVVAASNICAFLTPVGALAGIMFLNILRTNKVNFKVKDFMHYGAIISIPTLFVTLLTLFLL